jgi:hypothetical protein
MVWLDVMGNNGSVLYFVTDRVERRRGHGATGFAVTGIVGDGQYEGEVLVEVGAEVAVTYLDAWLAADEFKDFQRRTDLPRVTAALTEVAEQAAGGLGGHCCGGGERRGAHAGRVAETPAAWPAVA